MNTSLDDPLPAAERFIDAALTEHARLGPDEFDDELVHRILLATVNRNQKSHRDTKQVTRDWRMWMTGGAVAAALVGLILVALSTFKMDRNERQSDEFRFLVRSGTNQESKETSIDSPAPIREAEPYRVPLALVAPAAGGDIDPSRLWGNFELITAPDSSFELPPTDRSWIRQESFRITADRSHVSADRLTYEGNVLVEHPLFRIEASRVSVYVHGDSKPAGSQPLLAEQAKVTQLSPSRFVMAENLSFEPISGKITLTGVKVFQTAEGKLRSFPAGDQLVLDGERFTVESPPPIMKYASPAPVRP
jgi:hypothetical protein